MDDKFEILEIAPDIYISLKRSFRMQLFRRAADKEGSYIKLAKKINMTSASVISWKDGTQSFPLFIVKNLADKSSIDDEEIKNNIDGIGIKTRGIRIKNPKLTIHFDKYLARLLGHIYGDGCVRCNMVVSYTNQNTELTNKFKYLTKKIFGNVSIYERYCPRDKTTNLQLPKLVGTILNKIIIGFNEKKIPIKFFDSNPELIPEFLAAIFDDEGSVKIKSRELTITLADKEMIENIIHLFSLIEIPISGTSEERRNGNSYWRIRIGRKKNFIKFKKLIKLTHSTKLKFLHQLLDNYKFKFTKYELQESIMKELEKSDSQYASELARKLDVRLSTICKTLVKLEKRSVIKKFGKKQLIDVQGRNYSVNLWCLNEHNSY